MRQQDIGRKIWPTWTDLSYITMTEEKTLSVALGKMRRLRRMRRLSRVTYWAAWGIAGIVFLGLLAGGIAGLASG
jgi:hypothetical protein